MKKAAALTLSALLLALLLSGCGTGEGLGRVYRDEEEGITLYFDDLLYTLTEDDVTVSTYQLADGNAQGTVLCAGEGNGFSYRQFFIRAACFLHPTEP